MTTRTRLRYLVNLNPSVPDAVASDRQRLLSYIPMEAIGEDWSLDLSRERSVAEVSTGYSYFEDGDIVFAKVTPCFENGKAAIVEGLTGGQGFGTTEVTVVRPDSSLNTRFLFYVLNEDRFKQLGVAEMTGAGGLKRVPDRVVRDFAIDLPPRSEQDLIARFLDRETAEIDAFIRDQEELIKLLVERRAATIGHAVTQGLGPASEMKQTRSAWFPVIPSGWDLLPVRLGASLIQTGPFGSQLHADEYVTGGTPLINPMHIVDGEIRPSAAVSVTESKAAELKRHALLLGDVVIARRGELGRSAVTTESSVGALCGTGSAIIRLRSDRFDPQYFQLAFSSRQARDSLLQYSVGSTMDNLNADVVGDLRLPAPPVEEQRAIVRSLEHETTEIDGAIADAREAIALSRERRAALISAAVTRKIDLRDAA